MTKAWGEGDCCRSDSSVGVCEQRLACYIVDGALLVRTGREGSGRVEAAAEVRHSSKVSYVWKGRSAAGARDDKE